MSPIGREQGDELPTDPPIYVGTVNGEPVQRAAHSPADEVNLRARGWVRKTEKHAGKRAREQARIVPSAAPAHAAADTEGSNG